MTETHIAGELHGLSAHPGDIYHRAAMTVEMLIRERDEARADALSLNGQLQIAGRRFDHADAAVMAAEARIAKLEAALKPFAAMPCGICENDDPAIGVERCSDDTPVYVTRHDHGGQTVTAGHFRTARAALKEPVASLREAGLAKPHCPNLEGREHD
jgi:hypothetical protein